MYSVKKWLERYILGVNCYISDINGEGIILERMKTVGYVTEHEFRDIEVRGCFTPNVKQVTEFKDSSTILQCSLNEFSAVTFEDYADFSIEQFINKTHYIDISVRINLKKTNLRVYESAPLCAMTVADEYEFTLYNNNCTYGSLYEFTDDSYTDNPIIIADGEIKFWDEKKTTSVIDSDELPIICI